MTDMPTFATLRIEADGPRGRLVLDRPERRNALNDVALRELVAAARWFDDHTDAIAVTVTGAGRSFCAGADFTLLAGDVSGDRRSAADLGRRMADALEAMRAVTVAGIHGHCVGGGVVLAAACDLRVAAAGTSFSIPEVDIGIPLGWGGMPRLVREIGPARAKELVMTCRPFDADEALALGFLNRVVPADRLDSAVEALADTLAGKPAGAVAATKRHANAVTAQAWSLAGSWSDAFGIVASSTSREGRDAAAAYLGRFAHDTGETA